MNEVRDAFRSAAPGSANAMGVNASGEAVNPAFSSGRGMPADIDRYEVSYSDNGYDFVGEDSLGEPVKGFVQTSEADLAEKELERAGIRVESIKPKRGLKRNNRRPTAIEFATLAEQFGDLMEIGESPTQVCRLLSFSQTNALLGEALLNASELVINGRSLSEAFAHCLWRITNRASGRPSAPPPSNS